MNPTRPSTSAEKRARYAELFAEVDALLEGEDDAVAAMATVVCAVHHAFDSFHWTGFYRVTRPGLLVVGPYQGGHGCTRIPFERGVCGAAARERRAQLGPDVHAFTDHIACSSTTQSEVVVPVFAPDGRLLAVFDVDSDLPAAFDAEDAAGLEAICARTGAQLAACGA